MLVMLPRAAYGKSSENEKIATPSGRPRAIFSIVALNRVTRTAIPIPKSDGISKSKMKLSVGAP